ncbi:MAG: type I methionyl aminopeptidase [bacterium]|nr:type I methionyl aminopeptidase [bacterium]
MVYYKSAEEIKLIRLSCQLTAQTLNYISEHIKPGISTLYLDRLAEDYIRSFDAVPSFLGFRGYPNSICASVNNVVVHGIPRKDEILREGDIITIDVGVCKNGYYGDKAITYPVGEISSLAQNLIKVTEEALDIGITEAVENNRLGDIGNAIQTYVEQQGFSVVRDFVGHGIGSSAHEDPQVQHFGKSGTGFTLKKGLVIAIEPMINVGSYQTKVLSDGWTAVSSDGSLSAQFEHVVAITDNTTEILTLS